MRIISPFAHDLESRAEVRLYVKPPGWFTVPTPVREYNPDWAVVLQPLDAHGEPSGEPRVYLVAETRASLAREQLRSAEAGKIECGKRHFREALGVRYQVVTGVGEIVSRWDGEG